MRLHSLSQAALCCLIVLSVAPSAWAQSRSTLRDAPRMRQAFRPVVNEARQSVAEVYVDKSRVALATIVDTDGWLITKASELHGKVSCKLGDRYYDAEIVGVDQAHDLALLKIAAANLRAVQWNRDQAARPGQWVVTAGVDLDPVAIGVASVAPRSIPSQGVLGVHLSDVDRGVKIVTVNAKSGAEKAGLLVDDVVTHAEGERVRTRQQLISIVKRFDAGMSIRLNVVRGDKPLEVVATLTRGEIYFQDRISGALSERAGGFPRALQHDTILEPQDCGGPLLDLDGKAVGVNIARAGRVISYALPADTVARLMDDVMNPKIASYIATHGSLAQTPPLAPMPATAAMADVNRLVPAASAASAPPELPPPAGIIGE